jgi:hypothetical protein
LFFCFLFFFFAFYQNETPSLRGVYIFSTTGWRRSKKKRNVATLSESVYTRHLERASPLFYLFSLFTDIFFFVQPRTNTWISNSLPSVWKKKTKQKQEFALIPGFRTKKKIHYTSFIFLTRLKAVWFSETSAHLCSLLKKKNKLVYNLFRGYYFFPAYIQILYISMYFSLRGFCRIISSVVERDILI